jgi:hypothetical protein
MTSAIVRRIAAGTEIIVVTVTVIGHTSEWLRRRPE